MGSDTTQSEFDLCLPVHVLHHFLLVQTLKFDSLYTSCKNSFNITVSIFYLLYNISMLCRIGTNISIPYNNSKQVWNMYCPSIGPQSPQLENKPIN